MGMKMCCLEGREGGEREKKRKRERERERYVNSVYYSQ